MYRFKDDFPIFQNNKGLVFLDNASSTQKPAYVIDGISKFVSNDYANIHRGNYSLSERSEDLFHQSKQIISKFLNCKVNEVIYTYNATYGINLIAQSLCRSQKLTKGDVVLIGIREHHANVLPRQILSETYGFEIRFIEIGNNYDIDRNDFDQKYDDKVKVVACGHVSNVTGHIYDVKKIKSKLRDDTFLMIDGSQSVPNFQVDVMDLGCDCLVFTGHKIMAYTGIGAIYLKKNWIKELQPLIAGGGTISDVSVDGHVLSTTLEKFESGTPNIIGAVSLLYALQYIESVGGIEVLWKHDQELVKYVLEKAKKFEGKLEIVGSLDASKRIGVFSFVLSNNSNFNIIGEKLAEYNICVRCGGHCAYPLHKFLNKKGTCRMSVYFYNDKEDIDKFFEVLSQIL